MTRWTFGGHLPQEARGWAVHSRVRVEAGTVFPVRRTSTFTVCSQRGISATSPQNCCFPYHLAVDPSEWWVVLDFSIYKIKRLNTYLAPHPGFSKGAKQFFSPSFLKPRQNKAFLNFMSPKMAQGNNTWLFRVVSADALATGAPSINPQTGQVPLHGKSVLQWGFIPLILAGHFWMWPHLYKIGFS